MGPTNIEFQEMRFDNQYLRTSSISVTYKFAGLRYGYTLHVEIGADKDAARQQLIECVHSHVAELHRQYPFLDKYKEQQVQHLTEKGYTLEDLSLIHEVFNRLPYERIYNDTGTEFYDRSGMAVRDHVTPVAP